MTKIKSPKAKQKVDLFVKKLDQVTKIFQALNVCVYPKDKEMLNACSNLAARMIISDEITDDFLKKILGFYHYAESTGIGVNVTLTTFFHDIGGIVNKDICFSPRCERYGIYFHPDMLNCTVREILLQINKMPK